MTRMALNKLYFKLCVWVWEFDLQECWKERKRRLFSLHEGENPSGFFLNGFAGIRLFHSISSVASLCSFYSILLLLLALPLEQTLSLTCSELRGLRNCTTETLLAAHEGSSTNSFGVGEFLEATPAACMALQP